jgi:DMSO/TMAO reductase YedYZ molybdopterin-dependent catalytic subunit
VAERQVPGEVTPALAGLPPGQRVAEWHPFGLPRFARVQPVLTERPVLIVGGAVRRPAQLDWASLAYQLKPREQHADLHCVTTWTARDIGWSGYLFREVHALVAAMVAPVDARWLVLRGLDGYRCCVLLADALADDVMIATHCDGEPLPVPRGGALRLVVPAHYGYKSVKHLYAIEYRRNYVPGSAGWAEHPRGRVAREERSRFLPGWVWRPIWRAMVPKVRSAWNLNDGSHYSGPAVSTDTSGS